MDRRRSGPRSPSAAPALKPPGEGTSFLEQPAHPGPGLAGSLLEDQPGSGQEEQSHTKAALGSLGTGKAQKEKKIRNFNSETCAVRREG